jgi:hypothetical protein
MQQAWLDFVCSLTNSNNSLGEKWESEAPAEQGMDWAKSRKTCLEGWPHPSHEIASNSKKPPIPNEVGWGFFISASEHRTNLIDQPDEQVDVSELSRCFAENVMNELANL